MCVSYRPVVWNLSSFGESGSLQPAITLCGTNGSFIISQCKACMESSQDCSSFEVPRSHIYSSFQPHSSINARCAFCLSYPLHRLASRMKSRRVSCSRRSVNQLSQIMIARLAVNLAGMKLFQTAMLTRARTYDNAVSCIATAADFIRGPIRGRCFAM